MNWKRPYLIRKTLEGQEYLEPPYKLHRFIESFIKYVNGTLSENGVSISAVNYFQKNFICNV